MVVEVAIERSRAARGGRVAVVVDLGTGSGAIALACAAELPLGVEVWATDVSVDALDVARANLAGLGRRRGERAHASRVVVRRVAGRAARRDRRRRQQPALHRRRRAGPTRSVASGSRSGRCSPGRTASTRSARSSPAPPAWLRPAGGLVLRDRRDPGRGGGLLLARRRLRGRRGPPGPRRSGPHPHCMPRPSASRRNSSCSSRRFSATTSCGVMWVTPDSGSTCAAGRRPAAPTTAAACARRRRCRRRGRG